MIVTIKIQKKKARQLVTSEESTRVYELGYPLLFNRQIRDGAAFPRFIKDGLECA